DQLRDRLAMCPRQGGRLRESAPNQGLESLPILPRHRHAKRLARPALGQERVKRTQPPFLVGLPPPSPTLAVHLGGPHRTTSQTVSPTARVSLRHAYACVKRRNWRHHANRPQRCYRTAFRGRNPLPFSISQGSAFPTTRSDAASSIGWVSR